jgi:hypothetical protein
LLNSLVASTLAICLGLIGRREVGYVLGVTAICIALTWILTGGSFGLFWDI